MDTIVTAEIVNDLPAPRDSRIDQANALYTYSQAEEQAAATHARNAIMAGLQLGYLLTQLKDETPRGQWSLLFSDAAKRVQTPNALRVKNANGSHENHFTFASSTARKYMTCYKAACARLAAESEEDHHTLLGLLSASTAPSSVLPDHATTPALPPSPDATPTSDKPAPAPAPSPTASAADLSDSSPLRQLLDRATDHAETPRQMMLHFGIIKPTAPKYAPTPTGQAAHETILANRNTVGRPKQPILSVEEATRAAIAAVRPEEEIILTRRKIAIEDCLHLIAHLQDYMDQGLAIDLPAANRDYLIYLLTDCATRIKNTLKQTK